MEDAIVERLDIDVRRCKGCGLCVEFCPKHCLELGDGMNAIGYHPAELHKPEACTSCSLCAEVCPEAGIRVFRKKKGKP
ncbi:MAG: 4Fe-4S binding protein [Planctomycetes bacterium]|nr:4Fe-4S binding protein [Planctomycetota bacterium]